MRRHRKAKPKIIKKKKKASRALNRKSRVPTEVAGQRPDLQRKLGIDTVTWDDEQHVAANMERMGLVADVTAGFGRNATRDAVAAAAADPAVLEAAPDDELAAACGQQRSTGRAPPKRLTTRQRQIVQRLVDAHGADVEAMARDRRLNTMQHSAGALHGLLESFHHWHPGSGVGFRAPNKRLW